MWQIKVPVFFGGELLKTQVQPDSDVTLTTRWDEVALKLEPQVQPDSHVYVFIPILVNHKVIAGKSKLQLHKVTTEKKEKKEKVIVPTHVIEDWSNKRKAMSHEEARPKVSQKKK